jgi:hypothetical protein
MNRSDRKRKLIAEGRVWRAEVLHSKEVVREGLRPDSMARRVLSQVAVMGVAALRAKGGIGRLPGINLGTVLPLVVSGVTALAKRKTLLKPALRGAAIAGAVAAAAAFLFRRRKKRADDMETTASDA